MTLQLSPTLEVNLAALVSNYHLLASRADCAAVVKANAYGLGVGPVASALYEAGCRTFFVATLDEGAKLREVLPDAVIYVFHGCRRKEADDFLHYRLIPVLNSPAQIQGWNNAGNYALHIDTGMCRLGLDADQVEAEAQKGHSNLTLILSHLACADDPANPKNTQQLALFNALSSYFPRIPRSLANSAGIFLGNNFHFDLLRPGCALYGISPAPYVRGHLKNVVTLWAPVLQYRCLSKAETVGYGASISMKAGSVLATVEIGYADGLMRCLGGKLHAMAAGITVPVIGRISMDMVSVDVSAVPKSLRNETLRIYFIHEGQTVDTVAEAAGTIGYEVFTGIGQRVRRSYSAWADRLL